MCACVCMRERVRVYLCAGPHPLMVVHNLSDLCE